PDELYEIFGQGKGAGVWGEKSPFYCCHLTTLAERNPHSPFILIWRDPVEIYRSIVQAGRTTRFFRRPGMLSRLIRYHEKMIEQAAELEKAGARVYHVTYSDLIDNTSAVCEGICKFLGVPFDSRMLDLSSADLSAVYQAAQHDYLRGGVIRRQKRNSEILSSPVIRKLERFRNRWSRLNPGKFASAKSPSDTREPSSFERIRHRIAGELLCGWDDTKRVLFEFMPLDWLQTYRGAANWFFFNGHVRDEPKRSFAAQLAAHWVTIGVAYFLMAGSGFIEAVY